MNLKKITLGSILVLSLPGIGLISCKKKKTGVSVRVTVTDANTARVWKTKTSDGRIFVLGIRTGEKLEGGGLTLKTATNGTPLGAELKDALTKAEAELKAAQENYKRLKEFGLDLEKVRDGIGRVAGLKLTKAEATDQLQNLDAELKALDESLKADILKIVKVGQDKELRVLEGYSNQLIVTSALKRDIITDALLSAEDSNANDARISWIKVTYIDDKGKRIEDNIGEQPIGASFSKEYTIPSGRTITVTAKATQTGKTRNLAEEIQKLSDKGLVSGIKEKTRAGTLTELKNLADSVNKSVSSFLDYYVGKNNDGLAGTRSSDGKVKVKIEVLKDGIVVGGKEVEAEKEVEATSVAYGVVEK